MKQHIATVILFETESFLSSMDMLQRRNFGQRRRVLVLVIFSEKGVLNSCFYGDSLGWLQVHHLGEEVQCFWIRGKVRAHWYEFLESIHTPFGESHLHIREIASALPDLFIWSTQNLKYLKQLTYLAFPIEDRFAMGQLIEDATNGPNIHSCTINPLPKQNFRSSIP